MMTSYYFYVLVDLQKLTGMDFLTLMNADQSVVVRRVGRHVKRAFRRDMPYMITKTFFFSNLSDMPVAKNLFPH